METVQNFRSALHGFNREDVVRYLEYLNAKYTTQVNQLTAEAEELRSKLSAQALPEDEAETVSEELETLRDKLAQSEAANEELQARCTGLEKKLEEQESRCKELEHSAKQPLAVTGTTETALAGRELEAYRRAERAERDAKERADVIYRRTNGILADATSRIDATASQIGAMSDDVLMQLKQLEAAVTDGKKALQDAVSVMYSLRPDGEEN